MNIKPQSEKLYGLLGVLPPRDARVSCKTVSVEKREKQIVERLVLTIDPNPDGQEIPAYFIRPYGEGPFKAVLFSHSHGGFYTKGKEEVFKPAPYMFQKPYADELTENGYALLAIDHYCFGERCGRSETSTFKEMLWKGEVMWGKMVYDSLKALEYLQSRPDVDSEKISAVGMSMGSTMSYWVAALDAGIHCVADIGCLTDFEEIVNQGYLDEHGIYYFVPGLFNAFSASELNALIAPVPRFAAVGLYDHLTPMQGVDKIEKHLKMVYRDEGVPQNILIRRYPTGHLETAEVRCDLMRFLNEHTK